MSESEEILAFCQLRDAALVGNDPAAIARHMAEGWVLVSPLGIEHRASLLGRIATRRLIHTAMVFASAPRIALHGATAIVTARKRSSGIADGVAYATESWLSDVLQRDHGQWKCVLSQVTPLAAI